MVGQAEYGLLSGAVAAVIDVLPRQSAGARTVPNMPLRQGPVSTDYDLLYEESHHTLAVGDIQRLNILAYPPEKCRKRLGQAPIGGLVGGLGAERGEFGLQCLLTLPKHRHAPTQILQ